METLKLLDESIVKAMKKCGIETLTQIQELAIPKILDGKNVILISPTGTGKTLAVLLPIFSLWVKEKPKPTSIIYITPLRSLNRDLISHLIYWGKELDMEIGVRHGDTSRYERRMQTEFPNDLLISTPETLQSILVGKRIREHLKNVRWVILDDIHEITDSKRGVQLALALERLRKVCNRFQLIMLSATIGEPEKVAKFFSGGKDTEIIKASILKQVEIKVISPRPQPKDKDIAEKIFSSQETAARLRTIMELIKGARSTLVFTNTREFAEILASRMKTLDQKFPIEVHHSSLSKEVRIKTEKEFKEERIKAIVCTSSLQLGIDIGSIDLVLQYMSPREVTQLIQRIGRSGHAIEKTSRGIIIATDEDDIFESAVIARKALNEELERIKVHENSFDVLAHQILGFSLDFWKPKIKEVYETFKNSYPYRNLSFSEFLEVCKQLQQLGLIFLNEEIRKRKRGFEYYFQNISTIPDVKQFKIFNTLDNSFVGVLDEEFVALHGEVGTNFIVKGEAWKILDISEDKVLVEPTIDIEAAIPAWEGELIPVSFEVAQEVGELRRKISSYLQHLSTKEVIGKLMKEYSIDENCARRMIYTIKKQLEYGIIPDDKTILIEDCENLTIIHACFGSLVNESIGRLISSLLAGRIGSVGLKTDPYRIIIQSQVKCADLIKEILLETKPEFLKNYVEISLANTDFFEWRFVHVAKRFGAIAKNAEYGRIRMRKIIEEYAGSPIYKETLKEIETEKMDLERAKEILRQIQEMKIKVIVARGLSFLGKVGIKHKYIEVVGTEKEKEIFEIFKKRLLNTKVNFVCVNCGQWSQGFLVKEVPSELSCSKCGARLLAVLRYANKEAVKIIKKKIRGIEMTKDEEKNYERIRWNANLFLTYGKKAVYCLAARGIGPETTTRILAKLQKTEDEIFRDILSAERNYLRTKRYWSI